MFGFFRKIINKKNEDSPEYRLAFAQKISDKRIKYLSERTTDNDTGEIIDTILGKEGHFHINKENELVVYCEGREHFRAYIPNLKAYEFLSLEGVILESYDLIQKKERQLIAYYKYYR
jgi:hypothetical protein